MGKKKQKNFNIQARPFDVIIPTSTQVINELAPEITVIPYLPFDVLLRLVPLPMPAYWDPQYTDHRCYLIALQVFPMANWDTIDNMKDYETAVHISDTAKSLVSYLCDQFFMVSSSGPSNINPPVRLQTIMNLYCEHWATEIFDNDQILDRTQPAPDGPYNVMDLVSDNWVYDLRQFLINSPGQITDFTQYISAITGDTNKLNVLLLLLNLLKNISINGPGLKDGFWGSETEYFIKWNLLPNNYSPTYFPTSAGAENIYGHDTYSQTSDNSTYWKSVYQYNVSTFSPYVKYNLYSNSVHFQSAREQVEEAKFVIWSCLAAVVAVTLATIIFKFRKNRAIRLELAQANLDSYAWSLPSNPTNEQLREYKRLKGKVKRINKLNSLLGISNSADEANLILSSVHAINDQLFGMQGYTENGVNETVTLKTVKKLIKP